MSSPEGGVGGCHVYVHVQVGSVVRALAQVHVGVTWVRVSHDRGRAGGGLTLTAQDTADRGGTRGIKRKDGSCRWRLGGDGAGAGAVVVSKTAAVYAVVLFTGAWSERGRGGAAPQGRVFSPRSWTPSSASMCGE